MHNSRFRLTSTGIFITSLGCTLLLFLAHSRQVDAQESVSPVVVTGEEVPSAYGAPPAFSRSRFAPLTNAYVLPPWGFLFATIYQGDAFDDGPPDHSWTQEVEMGLPYRFGLAAEVEAERFNGEGQARSISLEARYALADWNKIPLNPTIFAEYKFGVGKVLHEEGGEEGEDMDEGGGDEFRQVRSLMRLHGHRHVGRTQEEEPGEEGEEGGRPDQPDAYEFRLLLSQDFGEKVEWALNGFFEQEVEGDRGREWGFAQSVTVPVLLPNERLKVGVEMQYQNFTMKNTRDEPTHSFVIGPTVAWKPSRNTRLDVSPLFGATDDSPDVSVFAVFSFVFGGQGQEAEAPVSTRNR
jgi:hypothetical protein